MKHRVWRLIAAATVAGGVMAPVAALAQEYPSPGTDPNAHAAPQAVATPASPAASTKVQSGSLPFTGGQLAGLTAAGLGAVGLGLVFVGFGRRRARSLL